MWRYNSMPRLPGFRLCNWATEVFRLGPQRWLWSPTVRFSFCYFMSFLQPPHFTHGIGQMGPPKLRVGWWPIRGDVSSWDSNSDFKTGTKNGTFYHIRTVSLFPQMCLILFLSKQVSEWLMVALKYLCESKSDFTSVRCWYSEHFSLMWLWACHAHGLSLVTVRRLLRL